MPLKIHHPDAPDHVVTFDATTDRDRAIIVCSCGANLSHVKFFPTAPTYDLALIEEHLLSEGGGRR